jgi:hypothetical protein
MKITSQKLAIIATLWLAPMFVFADAPNVQTWQPSSINGPALFVGTLLSSEKFSNTRDTNYGCHENYKGKSPDQFRCIDNGCGLETLTFRVDSAVSGDIPSKVTLNRATGEWCDGVSAINSQFIVMIYEDKTWFATKVVKEKNDLLAIPTVGGCLGNIDIKPALKSRGTPLSPHIYDNLQDWYVLWDDHVHKERCWIRLPDELADKGLDIEIVAQLWRDSLKH